MPKIDWSQNEEKYRCFHKPLCPIWQTTQGRQLRVCRMSVTHLDNAIQSIRRMPARQQASDTFEDSHWDFIPDMEDEVDYWLEVIEILATERKRRK